MVPAWRRLGLKLRSGDQSGDPAPDLNGPRSVEQQGETRPALKESGRGEGDDAPTAEKGKPSGLGKRKHHEEPAEADGKTLKKSRKTEQQEQLSGRAAAPTFTTAREQDDTPVLIPRPDAESEGPRPKGDPNYRKKKGRRISSPVQGSLTQGHGENAQLGTAHGARSNLKPPSHHTSHQQSGTRSPSPGERDEPIDPSTLVPSTEIECSPSLLPTTPRKSEKIDHRPAKNPNITKLSSSPARAERRKSVTFTPDTKTTDGNSASNLFKKWVAEQKGADAEFSSAEVAQFTPPPKVHPANNIAAPSSVNIEEKEPGITLETKKRKKQKETVSPGPAQQKEVKESESFAKSISGSDKSQVSPPAKPKGKKKDPSLYLSYLSQYHGDRNNWKFNKAKQNDVLDNCLNIFRIPDEYSPALLEYVKGLKGAAVIERLKARCETTLAELSEVHEQDTATMDDVSARKAAKGEALEERVTKERKRRQTDADVEALMEHPHPEGFIRRLKRQRAEALLSALNLTNAIPSPSASQANGIPQRAASALEVPATVSRNPRRRKLRTEVSSDESSSSESSSESSSGSSDTSSGESSESDGESQSSSSSDGSDDENSSSSEDEDDNSDSVVGSGSGSGPSDSEEEGSDDGSDSGSE